MKFYWPRCLFQAYPPTLPVPEIQPSQAYESQWQSATLQGEKFNLNLGTEIEIGV